MNLVYTYVLVYIMDGDLKQIIEKKWSDFFIKHIVSFTGFLQNLNFLESSVFSARHISNDRVIVS